MPTYDYRCQKCGQIFEKFLSIIDVADIHCPACGAISKRQISAGGGLLFKGSGFYVNDYRKADYKKESKRDTETI